MYCDESSCMSTDRVTDSTYEVLLSMCTGFVTSNAHIYSWFLTNFRILLRASHVQTISQTPTVVRAIIHAVFLLFAVRCYA